MGKLQTIALLALTASTVVFACADARDGGDEESERTSAAPIECVSK
jgi:hypothetical protein